MASRVSESLILRTYPYREADLIVSYFTRDHGKLRGIARRAKRPKSHYGSTLDRLAHVRLTYSQRDNRELSTIEGAELIESQFDLISGPHAYENSVTLDFISEVSELLLPPVEPNEKAFRLTLAMLAELRAGGSFWKVLLYFTLWSVRLQGFLADPHVCADSRALAMEMLGAPIAKLAEREWTRRTAADLRKFLIQEIEGHVERRLTTASYLEALD
ncbi:MAG TPA: DNA repair protein RecO [Bryobacteraceae bacterium]|jgi:DNA repair protein RecO (recombination protein O)